MLTPRPQESVFTFLQIKSLFYEPTYRLQNPESGCIMLSQKKKNKKNKTKSLALKYLHIVAKEDPQARTVGSLVVNDGSQLSTPSPGYIFVFWVTWD